MLLSLLFHGLVYHIMCLLMCPSCRKSWTKQVQKCFFAASEPAVPLVQQVRPDAAGSPPDVMYGAQLTQNVPQ
jgi:hypothetical protein